MLNLNQFDHINQMITLPVIRLNGVHCIQIKHLQLERIVDIFLPLSLSSCESRSRSILFLQFFAKSNDSFTKISGWLKEEGFLKDFLLPLK
jgi:hypothetical protein